MSKPKQDPESEANASDLDLETRDLESQDLEESVETPFDHPLFLPAVLLALSLWFLWDGFVVPMEEHLTFNRLGFAVLAVATLWFGYKGIREMREEGAGEADDDPGAS